eukprot:589260-Prorocentrum_minimum.AAC.1
MSRPPAGLCAAGLHKCPARPGEGRLGGKAGSSTERVELRGCWNGGGVGMRTRRFLTSSWPTI